jgi:hypothetical protein
MYPFSCITLKTRPSSLDAGAITHSRLFLNSLFMIVVSPFEMVSVMVNQFGLLLIFFEAQLFGNFSEALAANV